jgi:KinB signaling pathway activation protein
MLSARLLVNLWLVGFLFAILLQTIAKKRLASNTSWGFAPGWQREIAFWNIGIVALIVSLRVSFPTADATILPALALLSLLLGANHLVAALKDRAKMGHWAGVAGNFLGVALYGVYLVGRR